MGQQDGHSSIRLVPASVLISLYSGSTNINFVYDIPVFLHHTSNVVH